MAAQTHPPTAACQFVEDIEMAPCHSTSAAPYDPTGQQTAPAQEELVAPTSGYHYCLQPRDDPSIDIAESSGLEPGIMLRQYRDLGDEEPRFVADDEQAGTTEPEVARECCVETVSEKVSLAPRELQSGGAGCSQREKALAAAHAARHCAELARAGARELHAVHFPDAFGQAAACGDTPLRHHQHAFVANVTTLDAEASARWGHGRVVGDRLMLDVMCHDDGAEPSICMRYSQGRAACGGALALERVTRF